MMIKTPVMPAAFLKALTPEAQHALGAPLVRILSFPFRVGRDSRRRDSPPSQSRRRPDSLPGNDLYLQECGATVFVSREHFIIDFRNKTFVLEDRGSYCGTLVEGELVGGKKLGGQKPLHHNDILVVGGSGSRFIFKFLTEESRAE